MASEFENGLGASSTGAATGTARARSQEFNAEIQRMRQEANRIQAEIFAEYAKEMEQAQAQFETDLQEVAEYERTQLKNEMLRADQRAAKMDEITARMNTVRQLYSTPSKASR
jgi:hypothetical protein